MTPEHLKSLHAAVYRNTSHDPLWIGYWLHHYVQAEETTWEDLAQEMGVATEKLVLLCLCRTPRTDCFQEDLRAVCERTGAREEIVARILRQEQAILHWRGQDSASAPGWLLAASNREEPADSEEAGESNDDED